MATALRYRLFGMGKMPPELEAASTSPDALIAAEGLSLKQTVDELKIPRASVRHGVKSLVGSVVVLRNRLLLSAGASVIVDCSLEPQPEAAAALRFDRDGIRVTFAVASVIPQGSGSVELHYRIALSPSLLAGLPSSPFGASIENAGGLLNGWKGERAR